MINIADLSHGSWYDGFLWVAGKQRGTGTFRYVFDAHDRPVGDGYFTDATGDLHLSYKGTGMDGFEPNILSIGEPAG
jgi:hypothetical protein